MATKYYALLTNIGAAKLANATALGEQVEITQMAVGDGNGALPTPNPAQTALVHELRRAPLNTLTIDPVNTNQIITEQVIPEDVGGWWIREIGLYDSAGDLIAIANCAETYKPLLQEGSGRVQVIRVILIVSSTQAITLKIDPSVVLATRQYVDDAIIEVKTYVDEAIKEHAESRDHPDGTLTAKGFVQLSSATNSTSEQLAATPKAVKDASDEALKITNNLSDLTNRSDARGALELGTAATKNVGTEGGNILGVGGFGIASSLTAQSDVDLNALKNFGFYIVRNASNAPINDLGVLYVSVQSWNSGSGGDANRAVQTVYSYANKNRVFRRTYFGPSSDWSAWVEFYSETHKPTATDVGAITRADAPVGIPQPWPTATVPTGWLKCNGAAFDKVKYPLLAAAYPGGKLPDLRAEFIRGWDDGRGVDDGRSLLSGQADEFAKHNHYVKTTSSATETSDMGDPARGQVQGSVNTAGQNGEGKSIGMTGGSETRPRNIAFNYIVRAA